MKLRIFAGTELSASAAAPLNRDEIQIFILPLADGRPALLRLLSAHTGIPEEDLRFQTGPHGKPRLDGSDVQFNLSHSGDYMAFALCASRPVGIDIEHIRPNTRMESIVNRFFHPDEAAAFSGLSDRQKTDFFYRRWTVREAFLKGLGTGFSLSPSSFFVAGPEIGNGAAEFFRIKKSREDFSSWQIQSVPAPDGYYCSVSYPSP